MFIFTSSRGFCLFKVLVIRIVSFFAFDPLKRSRVAFYFFSKKTFSSHVFAPTLLLKPWQLGLLSFLIVDEDVVFSFCPLKRSRVVFPSCVEITYFLRDGGFEGFEG